MIYLCIFSVTRLIASIIKTIKNHWHRKKTPFREPFELSKLSEAALPPQPLGRGP